MQNGVIKDFLPDRGFGFIEADDGSGDIFFHLKSFEFGQLPKPGMRVTFDIQPDNGRGRYRAVDVKPAKTAAQLRGYV
jgi:CspA family cold shock protein